MVLPNGLRVGETVGISIPIHLLDADVLATLVSKMSKRKATTGNHVTSEDNNTFAQEPGPTIVSPQFDTDQVDLDHFFDHTRFTSDHQTPHRKLQRSNWTNWTRITNCPTLSLVKGKRSHLLSNSSITDFAKDNKSCLKFLWTNTGI
jgi:hypothetical protein